MVCFSILSYSFIFFLFYNYFRFFCFFFIYFYFFYFFFFYFFFHLLLFVFLYFHFHLLAFVLIILRESVVLSMYLEIAALVSSFGPAFFLRLVILELQFAFLLT